MTRGGTVGGTIAARRAKRNGLVAAALLAIGCGSPPSSKEATSFLVLGFDGLDPVALAELIREDALPTFARLSRDGACGELEVDPPLLSPVVWTSLATGRSPLDHGIGHFTARDATGREIPVTSDLRRVPAVWNLWSDWGRSVGVVGWWATWPAEPVRGVVVSDRVGYHFLDATEDGAETAARDLIHPAERASALLAHRRRPEALSDAELAGFVDAATLARSTQAHGTHPFADDLSHLRWAVAQTLDHRDLGLRIWREDRPELLLVYFEGTDSVSHLFGHLHRRRDLEGELARQQESFGGAVEAMYRLADRVLAEFLATVGPETTVFVVSDHGFRLGELPDDPSHLRDLRRVSDRYHRDRGVLCVIGDRVAPGARLDRPRPADLVPTLVALAGEPLSRELPGRPLNEGFRELPRARSIASYGARPEVIHTASPEYPVSPGETALLEQLRSLGYLGGAGERSSSGERNLAFVAIREQRYREAARAFERLSREEPDDPGLRTGLATALAALGRDAAARREFDAALALDPLFLPALVNRGLFEERLGRREEALADYRLALRYDVKYEPARRALDRLGENDARPLARESWEIEAESRIAEGNEAVHRGDFETARSRFEAARALAPNSVAPLQGLSNVAFLTGDLEGAARHLERALSLEPDNALFRKNLERLRRRAAGTVKK